MWRVKLNLEDFFQDYRKISYIFLRSDWKLVKDVKQHIKKLFNLKSIHLLSEDLCYFPEQESVEVIKINKNETLKVVKKQKVKCTSGDENELTNSETEEIRKDNYYQFTAEDNKPALQLNRNIRLDRKKMHINPKKVKNGNKSLLAREYSFEEAATLSNNFSFSHNTSRLETDKLLDEKDQSSAISSPSIKNLNLERNKKRKRSKKCKKNDSFVKLQKKDDKDVSNRLPTMNASNIVQNDLEKQKHIRFNVNGSPLVENGLQNATVKEGKGIERKIVFKSYLDNVTEPRVVQAIVKPRIEVISNNIVDDVRDLSEVKDNNEQNQIIENNCTTNGNLMEIDKSETDEINDLNTEGFLSVDQYVKVSKPLNELPKIEEILIFKINRHSNENLSNLSGYICGKVVKVHDNLITLFLINGIDQFESVKDMHTIADGHVQLKFEDMIEPLVLND